MRTGPRPVQEQETDGTVIRELALALGSAAMLSACTTMRETEPARTATEQLLLSTAVDRAVKHLTLDVPPGTKVFLDTQYFSAYDRSYAIGDIRDRLLKEGVDLVSKRSKADVIAEVRAGAVSIDHTTRLLGLPSINIPVPFSGTFRMPEFALFKRDRHHGIAKLALTAYRASNHSLEDSVGPVYGNSSETHWVILLFGWNTSDLIPRKPKR